MKLRAAYLVILAFVAVTCAKQTAPTGGPKDEKPPKLVASLPKHEQVNVKSPKLELYFDEAIQLNNPREQIIITPSVGKKFEVTANKKKVLVDLKAELMPNTTYSINFREAIQDITEKNPAIVKIAFSTGEYIDSLSINGRVMDALNEKPSENYTVALAPASDTFNIFKHPATWITQADKKGKFSIENLKPGTYILYAFDDKSKNMIVDSKSERYGFIGKNIELDQNSDSVKIRTFKLDINKIKLITARATFAYFNLRFSKGLADYTLTPTDSTRKVFASLESDFTTLKLYDTNKDLDSLQLRVQAIDSSSNKVDTLIYVKFQKKEATRDKFNTKLDKVILTESNSTLTAELGFSKPITTFHPDSAFIQIDSLKKIQLNKEDFTWSNHGSSLSLQKKVDLNIIYPKDTSSLKQKDNTLIRKVARPEPQLIFKKATFISVENDTSALFASNLKLVKVESTAILEIKVNSSESVITQVLNRSGDVVAQRIHEKDSKFENLPADTYHVRVIIDLNKNGKWDAGSYKNRTEPEPIIYYRTPKAQKDVPLKANWQVGPLLITY